MTTALDAYTAGMLDGEGTIGDFRVSICQSEVNNGQAVLEGLQAEWGIGIVRKLRSGSWSSAAMWEWKVTNRWQLELFLRRVGPFLRVKAVKADELLARLDDRGVGKTKWAPDEDALAVAGMAVPGRTTKAIQHRLVVLGSQA